MLKVPGWKRAVAVAALSASSALLVNVAPAHADTPGSVISVTAKPSGWRGMPDGAVGKVVDYWMTGSDGSAQPASGALIIPPGTPPPGGWPIMAYDHGTSGLGPGCGGQSNPRGTREDAIIQRMVNQGFAVVAPDYLGLGNFDTGAHPYLEQRTEATATLDLLRAARATHPELSRTWGVIGFSQGGQAALGTGHLQATYAPDLDFRGTIAVDPESDVEKVLPLAGPAIPRIEGTDGALGFYVAILAGLRQARPDVDVDSYLTPLGKSVLDDVSSQCFGDIYARVRGLGVGELMARPLSDARIRAAINDYLTVPTSGYDAPILLLINVTDQTVPSPLHGALAAQLAANGVGFDAITGTGQHCELNPAMLAGIDGFLARIKATPA
ncbi:lipase family protein [Nocardia goodfellowii]|uniref:Dienelactone hydrolase n=1 Tax=Nocardia goodfellowii TaxID=882446 RepID=A0ABS4QBI9_9NOCA|nr:lipase family protein [Nocardia goodfellowii]MBP2189064.1 dienelactone hydrolase [Nocardia goodfellowii]